VGQVQEHSRCLPAAHSTTTAALTVPVDSEPKRVPLEALFLAHDFG
jgi:hypothetical protein